MSKSNTYKSSLKGFSATQNMSTKHYNLKQQQEQRLSPLRTHDNSINQNTQVNTANTTSISTKYQQSQIKLQQAANNYQNQLKQKKQAAIAGIKSNSISKCEIVDARSEYQSESPKDNRKHSFKIQTPQDSKNPLQSIGYYTKSHKQATTMNARYGIQSYSSLNQTKFYQKQQQIGRPSHLAKQSNTTKNNKYLFPSTTTAKADISTPKKDKIAVYSGQNSHAKQASGVYSTKNSDAKYHKKNSTSYGHSNPYNNTHIQPALFSNQKVIKESFVHKNLDTYLKQKYQVNNLMQKDVESTKNLQTHKQYQDQSFDNLVNSFTHAKTTKNAKNSDRNSTLMRNNTAKYLNLTKAKYGQQDKQVNKKRHSYNNVKPLGIKKQKKHKYNPQSNSSLTKLTIDFRKYNNNNADVSHDMSMDTHLEILNQSPQNILYSSLKKKKEYEFQQQQKYQQKLQRQLSYDLLKRSRSRSSQDQRHNSDLKQIRNSQSLSNLMLQHMRNVNATTVNKGSIATGSGVFDYTNAQLVNNMPSHNEYQDLNSSELQEIGVECEVESNFKDQNLRYSNKKQDHEGIIPYKKIKSPSVLVNKTNQSLAQKSANLRSRSRSPLKIQNQITKPDTLSSFQSSNVHNNGCKTATNLQNGVSEMSDHAAKIECFSNYIEQVKQVREERSLSKKRRDSNAGVNSMSRTSFVAATPQNHFTQVNQTTTAAQGVNIYNRPVSVQQQYMHDGSQTPSSMVGNMSSKNYNVKAYQAANSAKHQNLLRKQLSSQTTSDAVVQNSEFGAYNITQISEYKLGKVLGQGAYAVVKEGVHKTLGSSLAIKVYDKYKLIDAQRKRSVIREIKILKKMQHENIVTLFDAIDTQRQLYLVMENVEGSDLQSMLKMRPNRRISEEESAKIFMQLISAMEYVHNQDVAHRDIKLENILIENTSRKVKLIDFGFCCQAKERLKVFCGTPSYMSPEIVMKREYYGGPNDIWACGVLLYVLLCGTFPFKSSFEKDLFRKIARGIYSYPDGLDLSSEVQDLISQMLLVDPNKRPTASQILEHDWFARQGILCKPVYQIEINSSLVTSGAEDVQQSLDNSIKPYHKMIEEVLPLRTIQTQSSSSVVSNEILSVGTEGSNAIKCIERVQMKINQQQRSIGSASKQIDKINSSLTNNSGQNEVALNNHVIDMTQRYNQYNGSFTTQNKQHYSNTDVTMINNKKLSNQELPYKNMNKTKVNVITLDD